MSSHLISSSKGYNETVVSSPETQQRLQPIKKSFCPPNWNGRKGHRHRRDYQYESLLNNLLNKRSFHENEGNFHVVHQQQQQESIKSFNCSCFDFEEGVFIECLNSNLDYIQSSLQESLQIKSYSIYHLDHRVSVLPNKLFVNSKIEKLRISDSMISGVEVDAFKGLETSLKSVTLSNSRLTSIPTKSISILKALESLDLDGNEITSIDSYAFYGLPISSLNLQNNRIISLQEYSLGGIESSLTDLTLTANNLTVFPIHALKRLKKLKSLKLNNNFISSLPEDSSNIVFSSLESLDLRNNRITSLSQRSFISCPILLSLSLSNNNITQIHEQAFQSQTNLESLDLSRNQIKSIPKKTLSYLKNLKSLDLTQNSLDSLSSLSGLINLKEVYLSHNNLNRLLNDSFPSSLTSMFIEHNCISVIESGVFSHLTSLLQLHLSFNHIESVPVLSTNNQLSSLSLDNNLISSTAGDLCFLKELRDLRMSRNNLKEVRRTSFNCLLRLQELHLQNNVIESVQQDSFISLTDLEYLNLQGNEIKRMTHSISNGGLRYLYLNYNGLNEFSHHALEGQQHSLENLYLNHNNLTVVTRDMFSINMTALEKLLLNHNNIVILEEDVFLKLSNLRTLSLKDNRINTINGDTFRGLDKLETLDLSFNPIKEISSLSFSHSSASLSILYLDKYITSDYLHSSHSRNISFEIREGFVEEDHSIDLTSSARNCPVSLNNNHVVVIPEEASSKAPLILNVLLENVSIVGLTLVCSSLLFVLISIVSIAGVILKVKNNRRRRRVKQSKESEVREESIGDDKEVCNHDMTIPDLHLHLSQSMSQGLNTSLSHHLYCHESHLSPHLDIQLSQHLPDPPSFLTQEEEMTYRNFPLPVHEHSFYGNC